MTRSGINPSHFRLLDCLQLFHTPVTDITLASLEHMRYDTGVFVTLARQEGVT